MYLEKNGVGKVKYFLRPIMWSSSNDDGPTHPSVCSRRAVYLAELSTRSRRLLRLKTCNKYSLICVIKTREPDMLTKSRPPCSVYVALDKSCLPPSLPLVNVCFMASPPFAQLKGTYAANKSFHLALTLLIVWCAIIAGRSAKTRRGGVNGALGLYYSPSERIHLLRCVPGPEIWLELCSLHFQLPLTCVCCWLTDSTRHWKRQMTCWDRALHTNSAYPFLPQEHTHTRPRHPSHPSTHIDYYYLLISFHSNNRLKVQLILNQPSRGPRNAFFIFVQLPEWLPAWSWPKCISEVSTGSVTFKWTRRRPAPLSTSPGHCWCCSVLCSAMLSGRVTGWKFRNNVIWIRRELTLKGTFLI